MNKQFLFSRNSWHTLRRSLHWYIRQQHACIQDRRKLYVHYATDNSLYWCCASTAWMHRQYLLHISASIDGAVVVCVRAVREGIGLVCLL